MGRRPTQETVVKREAESAQFGLMERTAPEILADVLYESRVANAQMRKAGGGADLSEKQKADPKKVWSTLTSHQKTKAFLDYSVSLMTQPEIALRVMADLLEDSKEGRLARLALTRAIIQQAPKELTVDVVQKQGVMLVPTKAESLTAWMEETGLGPKMVEGEVVENGK